MFWEENEFGPESVWEINADYKPDQNISIIGENNQWCLMNGVRGFPNLGWGHNAPSENLMNDYEVTTHVSVLPYWNTVKRWMAKKWWQATTSTSTGKPIAGKANAHSTDVPTGVTVTGAIFASSVMPTSY